MKTIADHLLPYRAFLADKKQRIGQVIEQLEEQKRQDEANLQKISLNIVGIFDTVALADERQATDWTSFCSRYERRFETLTAPWRARLAAVREHGDILTQTIEEEKLSTANEIRDVFFSIRSENA